MNKKSTQVLANKRHPWRIGKNTGWFLLSLVPAFFPASPLPSFWGPTSCLPSPSACSEHSVPVFSALTSDSPPAGTPGELPLLMPGEAFRRYSLTVSGWASKLRSLPALPNDWPEFSSSICLCFTENMSVALGPLLCPAWVLLCVCCRSFCSAFAFVPSPHPPPWLSLLCLSPDICFAASALSLWSRWKKIKFWTRLVRKTWVWSTDLFWELSRTRIVQRWSRYSSQRETRGAICLFLYP